MLRRFGALFAFVVLAVGTLAVADDEIFLKGKGAAKGIKGAIASESAKGVMMKGAAKIIPAEEIDDIIYEVPASAPVLASISYRNAFNSERDWLSATDAKKRAAAYADALDKYQKTVSQVSDAKFKAALDFKIGYIRGKKAIEDGVDAKAASPAIAGLRDFVKTNPNSWQVARALTLLAELQLKTKDFISAQQTFDEILKLDVTDEVKNDARLQGALANIQTGNFPAAEKKLTELMTTLPKGSKAYARALVAQSECLIAGGKTDEAVELLKKAIKESDDKLMRAVAYNTLGQNFYKADQLKEARWEFLWVDVVYNQDKNEHARALYYLSHIFDKLADPEKAAQCRATLSDAGYAGTEYQKKMQKEQTK